MNTFVVAEPGCVHEGQLETMLRLIDAAHAAGANAFKNQYLGNPDEVRRRRRSDYKSYDWLNYPLEWHAICREKCNALGMQYGCSTNLAEDLAKVDPYVEFHKRPSFENNDHEWLSAAKQSGKRFMVSAGMLDHDDLQRLISDVDLCGEILQCTSKYPCAVEDLHLSIIRTYELDGLSDHSRDLRTGDRAVCAGAGIVEVHMRLDDTPENNPDYAVALSPEWLEAYVYFLRQGERAMGGNSKQIQPCEAAMLPYKVQA